MKATVENHNGTKTIVVVHDSNSPFNANSRHQFTFETARQLVAEIQSAIRIDELESQLPTQQRVAAVQAAQKQIADSDLQKLAEVKP